MIDDTSRTEPGTISSIIGAWLIAEHYAEAEMRQDVTAHEEDFLHLRDTADDRVRRPPRRRSHDPR